MIEFVFGVVMGAAIAVFLVGLVALVFWHSIELDPEDLSKRVRFPERKETGR